MTDALINDKPQFVRLFCENGLNILDYLTHKRLESLYRSLPDNSLAYILLQRRLSERVDLAGSEPALDSPMATSQKNLQDLITPPVSAKDLSLYEVRDAVQGAMTLRDCRHSSLNLCMFSYFIVDGRSFFEFSCCSAGIPTAVGSLG